MTNYDAVIIGAGFAGSTAARVLADAGKKVLVLEKRAHIGGNAYDRMDDNNVREHVYGPHIFHTGSEAAVAFLSRFTDWYPYKHKVLGYVEGKLVPIPFNLTSIELLFEAEKAEHLKKILVESYGMEKKVPILELRKSEDEEVRRLAEYIFEHVFKHYTMKQWGYSAEEIDPAVTARVPVHISYDDCYFQDSFQNMPKEGYTALFEKMLAHPNIEVRLNTEGMDHIEADPEHGQIRLDGEVFNGTVIYTGIVDELCGYCKGDLSYRSLEFELRTEAGDYQPVGTVNYPTPASQHAYTRISEYKKLMETAPVEKTTIAVEYPYVYDRLGKKGNVPYYPVFTEESKGRYQGYVDLLKGIPNLVLLGRLAEYRYYNMDAVVAHAIDVAEKLI